MHRFVELLLYKLSDATLEYFPVEAFGVLPDCYRIIVVLVEAAHHLGQRLCCLAREELAGLVGHHRFERATSPVGDHRAARSLRFQWRNTKVLLAGENKGPAVRVELSHLYIGQRAQKLYIR